MEKEIVFVTTNKGKLATAQKYFNKDVKIVYCDYEIEEPNINDIEVIATHKVTEAFKLVNKPATF